MKNTTVLLILFLFLTIGVPLQAQWTPQADQIFGQFFSIDAHRAVNAQVDWAGVNVSPWSSAPTLSGWITRTYDGGQTWQYSQIPGAEGYVVWGITALDANRAWVSMNYRADRSKSRIYRTQDGGATWQLQFQGRSAGYSVHFFDAQNGVMIRRGVPVHTADGGQTWTAADSLLANSNGVFQVPTEAFDAYQDTIWFPALDGRISRSTNKGKTWQTFPALQASGNSANLLDFGDGRHGLAAALYQNQPDASGFFPALPNPILYATSDGGLSWQKVPDANLPVPTDKINIYSISGVPGLSNTFVMMAGYYNTSLQATIANLYQSSDGGFTWALLAPNPAQFGVTTLEFVSPTAGWSGSQGEVVPGAAYFFRWDGAVVDASNITPEPFAMQLMPNPASSYLNIRLPESTPAQALTAIILDAQGHLLVRNPAGRLTELNIQHLPPGAYTAMVQDTNGKIVGVKRWVKAD